MKPLHAIVAPLHLGFSVLPAASSLLPPKSRNIIKNMLMSYDEEEEGW
jgi:hypothetical protein